MDHVFPPDDDVKGREQPGTNAIRLTGSFLICDIRLSFGSGGIFGGRSTTRTDAEGMFRLRAAPPRQVKGSPVSERVFTNSQEYTERH